MSGLSDRDAARLRAARLAAARRSPNLEEIEDDLVPRGRRFVSASSDRVFRPARGRVFETGSAAFITSQPLAYTVAEDGTLKFYEAEPTRWAEQFAALARRRIKRGTS